MAPSGPVRQWLEKRGGGMGPELIAVAMDAALSSRAGVVIIIIIGGGIAGVSTLLALVERAVAAVLVEKGQNSSKKPEA
jgi:hypothetical protein